MRGGTVEILLLHPNRAEERTWDLNKNTVIRGEISVGERLEDAFSELAALRQYTKLHCGYTQLRRRCRYAM